MKPNLQAIYNQIPQAICLEGCSECCGPVFPSLAELRNIRDWCSEHHIEFRNFLDISEDGSCPYLSQEKKCVIYPVRPFLCRLLGVSLALPCPMKGWLCEHHRVLNKPQSDALYAAIYLHNKEKSRTEKHRQIVKEVLTQIAQNEEMPELQG